MKKFRLIVSFDIFFANTYTLVQIYLLGFSTHEFNWNWNCPNEGCLTVSVPAAVSTSSFSLLSSRVFSSSSFSVQTLGLEWKERGIFVNYKETLNQCKLIKELNKN